MGKIYYLIPDLCKREINLRNFLRSILKGYLKAYVRDKIISKHVPVGGIKVIYQHCQILKELGYEAYPLIMGSYIGNFFGYELDLKHIRDIGFKLNPGDVVVSTEFAPYEGLAFTGATNILFLQNWANLEGRLKQEDVGKSYLDLGYDYVITCGQYCTEMILNKMGISSTTITNGIDQTRFINDDNKRIPGRVLALSRKNPDDLKKIISYFDGDSVDFRIVDGLTQNQLIQEYQQADIFLAIGYPEGFSLPPLEAMSCGCAVVGFTGKGGNEFMINEQTALVAEDGDCETAAKQLKRLLQDEQMKETIRTNGINKARQYSLENTKALLNDFYAKVAAEIKTGGNN